MLIPKSPELIAPPRPRLHVGGGSWGKNLHRYRLGQIRLVSLPARTVGHNSAAQTCCCGTGAIERSGALRGGCSYTSMRRSPTDAIMSVRHAEFCDLVERLAVGEGLSEPDRALLEECLPRDRRNREGSARRSHGGMVAALTGRPDASCPKRAARALLVTLNLGLARRLGPIVSSHIPLLPQGRSRSPLRPRLTA